MVTMILTAVFLSWFIGQTIKMLIGLNQYHTLNLWTYLEDGGMPSTHASITVALTTALFYETGLSLYFVIAAVFTILVLNDTLKVKRHQGIQSELMTKMIDVREVVKRKVTESMGHTPEDVFAGAILGFFIASLLYFF